MYEKFTDRSRKVMQFAHQEAQRLNHEYVGTEHILLGLIKENSGVASNVLKNLDLDLFKLREMVVAIVQAGPDRVVGKLPLTPKTMRVVEAAIEEARNLNHNYVGTEHILLGLLRVKEGTAYSVLEKVLSGNVEQFRTELLNLLGCDIASEAEKFSDECEKEFKDYKLQQITEILKIHSDANYALEKIKDILDE